MIPILFKIIDKRMNKYFIFIFSGLFFLLSCSVQKRIGKAANKFLLKDSTLATAHVGIALYNTASKKFVYNRDGEKYFIPASNTKILTCYAAMKYLGDSLVGLRYWQYDSLYKDVIFIRPTGDPTFLHPDFKNQPVVDWIKKNLDKKFYLQHANWQEDAMGRGWNWDDYNADYMAERSEFPVYGNLTRIKDVSKTQLQVIPNIPLEIYENETGDVVYTSKAGDYYNYYRAKDKNLIIGKRSQRKFTYKEFPFITSNQNTIDFLKDTIKSLKMYPQSHGSWKTPYVIHSQPTDSLLKVMMHRSDNFYAEQTLLMVSNELLGVMSDEKIIDTLLKTDYKDLPQKPNWVDGSGLSRYNLVTPQDEVKVLEKMKNNFNWNRITTILSTGGTGTLRTRYKKYTGKIYAKTGSLSDVISLSGFITTHKNHSYIFSVMINHHLADETEVRDKIEKFISALMDKF